MTGVTLFRYLSWRLIAAVGGLFLAFTVLIMVIDLIENLRFAGKYANGSFFFALKITFLRALGLTQVLSPFLFLFGALWCFSQLNRRSEIAVMRSAGLSIWRVLIPGTLVAGVIGVLLIAMVDPLSSRMMAHSEQMKNDIRGKRTSMVQFFRDGIWLRQQDTDNRLIINAASINQDMGLLKSVTVYRFDEQSAFVDRIDAPIGRVEDEKLILGSALLLSANDITPKAIKQIVLETNLDLRDLGEKVAKPETISIWDLRRFIRLAEAAGLSTSSYYLRFHDLLSTPLKLVGMVLIAAVFSMQPTRLGGNLRLLIVAIAAGFILYVVSEISTAFGESGSVPLAMAAWTPAIIATLLAITGLLNLEDG